MRVHRIGEAIEGQIAHATPPSMSMSIVHKQNGAGCCHPAECWPCLFFLCPVLKRRSINWIGENATIKSTPLLCPFKPDYCLFCSTIDCTWTAWLDREPFIPCCQGLGSPCGPVGFATEEDMSYCLCINCNCVYNCLCKPCCGEGLYVLPCENGTCAFTLATRCLKMCACPLNLCIADSKTYRAVLIQQVARAQGVELSENQKKLVMKTSTPAANHMSR